jgi:phosphatidylinositol alpha-1,6-mannosyltransferase
LSAVLESGALGLFPSFNGVGGVERSGRIAWNAVASASSGEAHVICYGAPVSPRDVTGGTVHHAGTQAMAVMRASSRKWPARLILVWHIGMLKLLPLVRARGARVALFLHGIEAWRRPSQTTARLLRNVDLFLANSDFTWARFLEFHPELSGAAHRTVHLGVGAPLGNETAVPTEPPSALMIGRIARSEGYKGHDAVIAAWPQVIERIPAAKLRIVGPCDMRGELLTTAAKQVEIVGAVSEEEKERYLGECRVMALPSRGEGFGLVYPEAMRMGRPCIISNADAGREVVGDAGLAVDPSDVAQMAAALTRALTAGPEWDAWSQAARIRYESRYTEKHFRDRLLSAVAALS